MSQWVEYKPFYLPRCPKACGDGVIDDKGISKSEFIEVLYGNKF
jgi:hypothetical protein